ncbi:MAG: VanW family protein, partial [Acidimicrobiales bacterium]
MSRWSIRTLVVVLLVLLGLFLSAVAAWGVDKVVHADQVSRNVTLAGVPVGGMDGAELDEAIDRLAAATADDVVVVRAPGIEIEVSNAEAGIALDAEAVRAAVLEVGREGNPLAAFTTWIGGMSDSIDVEPIYVADVAVSAEMIRSAPGWVSVPPVEPSFSTATGELVISPGQDGVYLDPELVAETLAAEVAFGQSPFSVDVNWSPMAPRYGEAEIAAARAVMDELTDTDLTVRVNGQTAHIGKTTLVGWVDTTVGEAGLVPVFNEERVLVSLERLLDGYTTPFPKPVYLVEDGEVTYGLDGLPAAACCEAGVADVLYRQAQRGGNTFAILPTRLIEEDGGIERVETLGVTELVSEFTTKHACCQNRVLNIQRIADIVSGVVLEPGERFSVNDFVGERTREKGFVSAGTIQQGHFKDDVGGGISQFATTLFNAAFFAGLEFDDYQSHTIYISRYPYGREATLNYPDVDLAFINNTPYGVLIWSEYTETSITVQMYSTQYWDVEETGQSTWRSGACRSVETFRT